MYLVTNVCVCVCVCVCFLQNSLNSIIRNLSDELLQQQHRITQSFTTLSPPVAFVSDSTLKSIVKDDTTQSANTENNSERNILLFRGKMAGEIIASAKDQLQQIKAAGVKKYTCLHWHSWSPPAAWICWRPQTQCNRSGRFHHSDVTTTQSRYPAMRHYPSTKLQSLRDCILHRFVSQTRKHRCLHSPCSPHHGVHIPRPRQTVIWWYHTYDGIHRKSAAASTVITDALEQLYIRCQIGPSRLSAYRHAVQKAIPDGCFKCASHDHRADLCPVQSLQCTSCKRNDHMHTACGYQWLPCRHCAQFGHNSSDSSACPLLLSKDVTIINMKKVLLSRLAKMKWEHS